LLVFVVEVQSKNDAKSCVAHCCCTGNYSDNCSMSTNLFWLKLHVVTQFRQKNFFASSWSFILYLFAWLLFYFYFILCICARTAIKTPKSFNSTCWM